MEFSLGEVLLGRCLPWVESSLGGVLLRWGHRFKNKADKPLQCKLEVALLFYAVGRAQVEQGARWSGEEAVGLYGHLITLLLGLTAIVLSSQMGGLTVPSFQAAMLAQTCPSAMGSVFSSDCGGSRSPGNHGVGWVSWSFPPSGWALSGWASQDVGWWGQPGGKQDTEHIWEFLHSDCLQAPLEWGREGDMITRCGIHAFSHSPINTQ